VLFCVNATYVYGLGGNDFIITRGSDDKLYGGPGRDHMRAGGGNDLLDGGIGADYMVGGAGNDAYIIDDPDDAVIEFAGGGYDKVVSSTNYTSSIFYLEEIELAAGSVAVKIQGQRSDEVLRGNEKDNEIFGAWGNDTIYGGEGRDYLMGGYSSDVLTGGAGADRFVLGLEYGNAFDSTYAGIDTVMDFNLSEDRLLLVKSTFSKLGGELSFATVTSDALAETSSFFIVYNSSNGKLFYNQNGAAAGFGGIYGGHFATLTGKPALQAGHFELVP
jgi:Ca2+-binding RTX toxin-like protein